MHGVPRGRDVPQWGNPVRGMPLRLVLGQSRLARVQDLRSGQSGGRHGQYRMYAMRGRLRVGFERELLLGLPSGLSFDHEWFDRVYRL